MTRLAMGVRLRDMPQKGTSEWLAEAEERLGRGILRFVTESEAVRIGTRVQKMTELMEAVTDISPGYFCVVEALLAAYATLLLKHNDNPIAIILSGDPSTGKTSILRLFFDHPITVQRDDFTPAALRSHYGLKQKKDLFDDDLIEQWKHHMLVVPDLAALFRAKKEILAANLHKLTRVLDGQGLVTHSGTHGARGEHGDFLCGMVGGTTPLYDTQDFWDASVQVGSRLLFFAMNDDEPSDEELDIAAVMRFQDRLKRAHVLVFKNLEELFPRPSKGGKAFPENCIRSVDWEAEGSTAPELQARIRTAARLLSVTRREKVWRSYALLTNLACGRAIVYGRRALVEDDVRLVERVARDSIRPESLKALQAMCTQEHLTIPEARQLLGLNQARATQLLKGMVAAGLVESVGKIETSSRGPKPEGFRVSEKLMRLLIAESA